MQLIDAKWTPKVNLLKIKCRCGNEFWHRADRWRVKCPECDYEDHLGPIRRRYLLQNQEKGEKR